MGLVRVVGLEPTYSCEWGILRPQIKWYGWPDSNRQVLKDNGF